MPKPHHQRVAISIPVAMATQIEEVCKVEGRNRSEFFREAVRFYMNAVHTPQSPQLVMPSHEEERKDHPFRLFTEWDSQADTVYDSLR